MNVSSVKPAACASCDSAASSPFTRATNSSALCAVPARPDTPPAGAGVPGPGGAQPPASASNSAPLAAQASSLDEATALPHTRHHAFDQRRQQQHDGAADRSVPEYLQEQRRQRLQVRRVVLAGELPREVAPERQ